MIRFLQYFLLICQAFILIKAEPIRGENVLPASPSPLEFPFIVSIGKKYPRPLITREHLCTGSLITKRHVLTAAHCLEGLEKRQIDVIIGDVDLTTADIWYEVDAWITYNDWARILGKTIEIPINDIAIIKLVTMVNREGIIPVTITHLNNQQLYRTNAIVAGWGVTNNDTLSDVLLKGKVKILTPEQCKCQWRLFTDRPNWIVPKNFLCSSASPYMLIGCGDSGGPLLDKNNILLGVTRSVCPTNHWGNFTQEFLRHYKTNLHMSVYYYREFIMNMTNIDGTA